MEKFFKNPLMERTGDPWMYKHTNGKYYFMSTAGNRLDLWELYSMIDFNPEKRKTIWVPSGSGEATKDIWAPEIHFTHGAFYIYFTASNGTGDPGRRIYVLENKSEDPMQGEWVEKGAINTEFPGLDGTILEHKGILYFLYAGYGNFPEYGSAIYIVKMENPWTLTGENILLTKPEYDWEKQGGMAINEGPALLKRNNRIFVIYSASTTWSEDYSLGMLTASQESDLLDKDSWVKSKEPVFKKSIENGVVAPGHNSFTKSPDDSEDWIVYHALSNQRGQKLDTRYRSTRIQKFGWDNEGIPDFGCPVPDGKDIPVPSGE